MCLRSCDVRSQMERKSSQSSQLDETTVVVSAAPSPPGKGHFLAQLGHAHLPEPPGAPSKLAVPDQRRTLCTQNAYIVTERTKSQHSVCHSGANVHSQLSLGREP